MEIWLGMPKWIKFFLCTLLLLFIVVASSLGIVQYNDDNEIEEYIEDAIKDQIAIDIDLSPASEENQGI